MISKKLWYLIALVSLIVLPLVGCSGETAKTTQKGVELKVSGKVVTEGKSTLKSVFGIGADMGTLLIVNAQDGSTLGTAAIDAGGAFQNVSLTLPTAKSVIVFKATLTNGSFYRAVVPLDLSIVPTAGISASNSISIEISQKSTDIANATSTMLGVAGVLGDAGATLASVSKTYTDATTLVLNNGGQALAFSNGGLNLTGQFSNASLLPARDASTFTFDDLNNIKPAVKISSAFIPGKNPIVNFSVTNAATGKGISGLKTFGLLVDKLMPAVNGSDEYWVNYIDKGITLPAPLTFGVTGGKANTGAIVKPAADPGKTYVGGAITNGLFVAGSAPNGLNLTTNPVGSVLLNGYTVIDHGDGSYTAIFGSDITSVDLALNPDGAYAPTLPHRIGITVTTVAVPGVNATGPINPATGAVIPTFLAQNRVAEVYDFYPSTGLIYNNPDDANLHFARDLVTTEACSGCHTNLPAVTNFLIEESHLARWNTRMCVMCHTKNNTSGEGEFMVYIHHIHRGENLPTAVPVESVVNPTKPLAKTANIIESMGNTYSEVKFPQDSRNCTVCHKGVNANRIKTMPNRRACGACHNNLDFATGTTAGYIGGITGSTANPIVLPLLNGANHTVQTSDVNCAGCHYSTQMYNADLLHTTPDKTTNNPNTPTGASEFEFIISSVIRDATTKQPTMKFQIKKDGAFVTALPITGFTDGLTFYFAYSVPQDGITAPADFNVPPNTIKIKLANLIDATRGTLTSDGVNTFTAVFTSSLTAVPDNATRLTGAMMGTFKQTNLAAYPAGLVRKALSVSKVATGYTGRRAIVKTENCNKCHDLIGTGPLAGVHGGSRNNATLCSFCHNPNATTNDDTSGGWSFDSSTFIHSIHAAKYRTKKYTFQSAEADFSKVLFPGILKRCDTCHEAGMFDFSDKVYTETFMDTLLKSTVAVGTYSATPAMAGAVPSPWITTGVDYGVGFSYDPTTGITVPAADTTLVNSPIASACFACHDKKSSKAHMMLQGGSIYEARSTALGKKEACLVCHGTTANILNATVPSIKALHRWW